MSALFDTVVTVDWSARATPSPRKPSPDAIWWAVARRRGRSVVLEEPVYVRTRAEACKRLAALLAMERAAGRRVLAGFDFPFGYPRGTARRLTGRAEALALWEWLGERIQDAPDNANNRFAVAAAINRHFAGVGPLWGRPVQCDEPDVPTTGRVREPDDHPPERRLVEMRVVRAQPCWKLYTTGSVGSQALLGLPALARLRGDRRLSGLQVWPLETGLTAPKAPLVLAEIYPSLLGPRLKAVREEGEVLDAVQVRETAKALARLDAEARLAPLFTPDLSPTERTIVAREEAWILGVGFEAALRGAP
ncbi:MAG: molybdopterin guanine dinucleotide synthesis [Pseudomonadota bacterium]